LFIFEGVIDENNQNIESLYFIDFIPDYFNSFDLAEKLSKLPIIITDGSGCPHDFDRSNGFWKDSIYDGKRSWHYKCKKCGLIHDTRVSYQA